MAQQQSIEWLNIFPSRVAVVKGSSSTFNPLLLQSRDLNGNTDDSSTAISFTPATSSQKLLAKFFFTMPPSIDYNDVTMLRFRANVKAPGSETNVFKFQIRNRNTKKWELLENSRNMIPNEWNFWKENIVDVTSFGDYVNNIGNVVIRLISDNGNGNVQLDFMKIRIAVEQSPQDDVLSIGDSFTYDLPGAQDSFHTDVVVIDLFDTEAMKIAALKTEGRSVICYFSAGTVEDWRPDAGSFPAEAVGSNMVDWEGEKWLDTTNVGVRSLMADRILLAQEKGCQAVDPDNVDGYLHETGFNLSIDDTKDYLSFLSSEARSRGMLIGMKNAAEIAGDGTDFVRDNMDFSVVEECNNYDECGEYSIFIELGRPVFAIEYSAFDIDLCTAFEAMKFSLVFANYELNEFQSCTK
jgi:hypothetical protein